MQVPIPMKGVDFRYCYAKNILRRTLVVYFNGKVS